MDGGACEMTLRGHIQNGTVVLDEPAALPDGSIVKIEPIEESDEIISLRKMLMSFAGVVDGLPEDLAENHDHYIHGKPLE
jgi:hypothetical protein